MKRWRQATMGAMRLLILATVVAGLLGPCTGCAGLGFRAGEMELLESSAADARFMDRTWAERSETERREFVGENALRWRYFNDLVHGRQPVCTAESTGGGASEGTSMAAGSFPSLFIRAIWF